MPVRAAEGVKPQHPELDHGKTNVRRAPSPGNQRRANAEETLPAYVRGRIPLHSTGGLVTTGRSGTLLLVFVLVGGSPPVVTGCGHRPATPGAGPATSVGARGLTAGSACDLGLLTDGDVASLLDERIDGHTPVSGDRESCTFAATGGRSITVTLRRGLGRVTVDSWRRGRMPAPAVPMPGVGDEAVWVGALREVLAERHDLLCDIQASGPLHEVGAVAGPEQDRLGALCRRIFAAVDGPLPGGRGADSAR